MLQIWQRELISKVTTWVICQCHWERNWLSLAGQDDTDDSDDSSHENSRSHGHQSNVSRLHFHGRVQFLGFTLDIEQVIVGQHFFQLFTFLIECPVMSLTAAKVKIKGFLSLVFFSFQSQLINKEWAKERKNLNKRWKLPTFPLSFWEYSKRTGALVTGSNWILLTSSELRIQPDDCCCWRHRGTRPFCNRKIRAVSTITFSLTGRSGCLVR